MFFQKDNDSAKRVKTPTVIQMEAVECGAASLGIILGYFEKFVPLEELRIDCAVSRDGSKAFNIIKAAEKYGLVAEGYARTIEELREGPFPMILFWEYKHFLVLEGFKKDKVFLNDPGSGPRVISIPELEKSYSNVCLIFETTDEFEPGGAPPPLWSKIEKRLRNIPGALTYIFGTGLALLVPGFAVPAFIVFFLQTFFSKSLVSFPKEFLGAIFLTALFSATLNWIQSYFLNRLHSKLSIRFSSEFLWHLLKLPISFYTQRYAGEIGYRMTLNDRIVDSLTGTILSSALSAVLVLFYGAVMFIYDPAIALIGVTGGTLNVIAMGLVFKSRKNIFSCLQQDLGKTVSESISGLQHIESIKSKALESNFFSRWSGYFVKNNNAIQSIGQKDTLLSTLPVFFQFLSLSALLSIGSIRILEGNLTTSTLMGLQLLLSNFLQPINRFVGFSQMIQNMQINLDRLDDVMKNPIDPLYQNRPEDSSETKEKLSGTLEFKNVFFQYSPQSPYVIDNLSFVLKPGQRIALVGPSGSGKSTGAKLATGLYVPTTGEIFYDGKPMKDLTAKIINHSIATVDQDIFLFRGTIRENLTLWNPKIPDELMIEAAQDAMIHEEILSRKEGYDAMLEEGGANMSGGQRQRLEIARALLYRPSILILDEATSALDSKTEWEISNRIRERGCSVLMIAHRLSTIQDCDEIIVLNRGKVEQRGTHDQLKSQEGTYQKLVLSEVSRV
jgi:NHLM bacteriocin system ABC transporter peptidase/ATP-binding protein